MLSRRLLIAAVLLIGPATAACGDDEADGATTTTSVSTSTTSAAVATTATTEPADPIGETLATPHRSLVARAVVDEIQVHAAPGGEVVSVLPKHDPAYVGEDGERVDQVFLVDDHEDGWLQVLLPVRPNGTTGWVRVDDVSLAAHDFELVVELGAHRLTAYEAGEVVLQTDVAVGTTDTPTPGGRFFLNALLRPPNPDTIYGTYAYALSGYSDTLQRFAGGDGVIGIHGTNDPSVMGTDVSHGCIRMRNEDIESLVGILPLGTPVEIRA